ncbi:hypothetical protein AV530_006164 [Patagioenas fasciata monilis]|uniref:Uncharacterized protein n=1 Tax=Patagioenas fasciata monilis TaxID=372326 RepID=A0A1V4J911_PATFA|nr:hypothetical protein AV530_006164 [Patagioenas fasciata monilis]
MPKMAFNHHITYKSFSVCKQVQWGTFPRWLADHLCQEVVFHVLQESHRLFLLYGASSRHLPAERCVGIQATCA